MHSQRENFRARRVAPEVVKIAANGAFFAGAESMGYTEFLPPEGVLCARARPMGFGLRDRERAEAPQRACRRIRSKKFRSHGFHAETYFSAQSPQPFEDARLSQPHEDEERRSGIVAAARQGPQACFR
jgi:hypothetical protein